jgi:hypothetical protein
MMTEGRGFSNAKAKRELGWELRRCASHLADCPQAGAPSKRSSLTALVAVWEVLVSEVAPRTEDGHARG